MFHVRHLITQTNLSILKKPRNKLINIYYLSDSKNPSINSTQKNKEDFQHLIRIDHTETKEQKQIKLSEGCIKRLKELKEIDQYLRIAVDSGGCSGFEYKFSLDKINDDDKIIEQDSCKVLVDLETEEFIKGATIDYHEELIRSGFRILSNPNSEQGCSCGVSFSLKV